MCFGRSKIAKAEGKECRGIRPDRKARQGATLTADA